MRASTIVIFLCTACADRALDGGLDSASEGGSEATSSASTAATSASSSTGTSSTTSTSSSSTSGPEQKYDLGGGVKLDVDGPEVPPFSCDATPPVRALASCASFEAPWGYALVQCVAPLDGAGCIPPDDPEVAGWFEVCGHCGGQLVDGPCGPVLAMDGSCCYWGSFEDGYCPTG